MRLIKYRDIDGTLRVGRMTDEDRLLPLRTPKLDSPSLTQLLDLEGDEWNRVTDVESLARSLTDVTLLAPIDHQEVWGAGVTYLRSKVAREEESEGAARFYDLVYSADRPELFFKASANRVVGPNEAIRVRRDSRWTVPEPELGLVLSSELRLAGITLGNDVSARDIEGENPLYLPQAKVYQAACALGPCVRRLDGDLDLSSLEIRLAIYREGSLLFQGRTPFSRMMRPVADLIRWLGIDNDFPDGVVLLTGTGIVPPDELSLEERDRVEIECPSVGVLSNPVVRGR